jgi:hypothetical protein
VLSFLGVGVQVVLFPLLVVRSARDGLRERWWTVRGVAPGADVVAVTPEGLSVWRERGGREFLRLDLRAGDVVGVGWSPRVGFDVDKSVRPAALRVVARDATHALRPGAADAVGKALRDVIVAAAVAAWDVPATHVRPTRCPYCAAPAVLVASAPCPACGASPERVGR